MSMTMQDPNTKCIIKKEFLELYRKLPLSKIKVADLIAKCNISRGTFYFYFSDVYSLYRECEQDILVIMENELDGVKMASIHTQKNAYIKQYMKHLAALAELKDRIQIFLRGSEMASFRREFTNNIYAVYSNTLEFSASTSDTERHYMVRFFASGACELLCDYISNDCSESAETLAITVYNIMFNGTFPKENRSSRDN